MGGLWSEARVVGRDRTLLSLDYGFILKVNSEGSERKGSRDEVTISEIQKRTVHVGTLSMSSGVAGSP